MIQRGVACVAVLLAIGLAGCSENSDKGRKVHRVEGIAKEINPEKNIFTMTFKDDKGVDRELSGSVLATAEVIINGKAQNIKDVRPGDKVVVFGHKEGSSEAGLEQKLVATRVEVTRPKDSDWKTPGNATATPSELNKPPATAQTPPAAEAPAKPVTQAPAQPAAPTPAQPAGETDEDLREKTTGAIYAQIRIKMEEAIAERAKLLKEGRPASDPEIRRLEGVIMNARRLLTEAGEIVGEVDPPIVEQAAPPPAEGEQKPSAAAP